MEPAVGFEPTTCRLQGGCSRPAELSGRIVYDVRPLDSREERERASKYGADDGARTRDIEIGRLALCLLSYIRNFGASETLTLSRASKFHSLRALTRNITHSSHRVLDSQASLAHGEHQRVCATPGESPGNQIMLLNSVLAERAAQGSIRTARTNPYRGLYLADGTLFWVVSRLREGIPGGLAPHSLCRVVPRPACAFGSKEP